VWVRRGWRRTPRGDRGVGYFGGGGVGRGGSGSEAGKMIRTVALWVVYMGWNPLAHFTRSF